MDQKGLSNGTYQLFGNYNSKIFIPFRIIFCFVLSLSNIPVLYCHRKRSKSLEKSLFIILSTCDLVINYPVAVLDTIFPQKIYLASSVIMLGIFSQILSASISLLRCIKVVLPFYIIKERTAICGIIVLVMTVQIFPLMFTFYQLRKSGHITPNVYHLTGYSGTLIVTLSSITASIYTIVYLYRQSKRRSTLGIHTMDGVNSTNRGITGSINKPQNLSRAIHRSVKNEENKLRNATPERSQDGSSASESAIDPKIILDATDIKAVIVSNQSVTDMKDTNYNDILDMEKEGVLDPNNNNCQHPANRKNVTVVAEEKKNPATIRACQVKSGTTLRAEALKPVVTLLLMNVPYVVQLASMLVYMAHIKNGTCASICGLNFFGIPIATSCFNPIVLLIRNREFQLILKKDISKLLPSRKKTSKKNKIGSATVESKN